MLFTLRFWRNKQLHNFRNEETFNAKAVGIYSDHLFRRVKISINIIPRRNRCKTAYLMNALVQWRIVLPWQKFWKLHASSNEERKRCGWKHYGVTKTLHILSSYAIWTNNVHQRPVRWNNLIHVHYLYVTDDLAFVFDIRKKIYEVITQTETETRNLRCFLDNEWWTWCWSWTY